MTDRDVHDDERGSAEDEALERLLIRSAKLDVPSRGAERRALERALGALAAPKRSAAPALFAGFALAAAAAFALVFYGLRRPPAEVAAERVRDDVVNRSPSRPAPSASPTPAPCPALVVARGDAPLIEDWEQNDSWLLDRDGRKGSWITYDDGTGKQSPPSRTALRPSRLPGGNGASHYGLHISGGRFTDWGVTFGTELADAACYDASAYAGVKFSAKGSGQIRVGFQMIDVQDVKYGGFCKADCYDTHRKLIELSSTFQEYSVRWEELAQLFDAGPPVAFDPRRIRFLEFGVAPESTPFDVWLDDVAFIAR
jgi:hypothetical protein